MCGPKGHCSVLSRFDRFEKNLQTMAEMTIATEMVKAKATGENAVSAKTGYKVIKSEIKSKLNELGESEGPEEDGKKKIEISFWDAWKFRILFLVGCILGAVFIGISMSTDRDINILYGLFWTLWALFAFGLNWNYASTLSLYNSANQIEETYRATKNEVNKLEANNDQYEKQNEELVTNVKMLQSQETKLNNASGLLKGQVADLKNIQKTVSDLNSRSFDIIKERESIAGQQRRIVLAQKEEEVDYQSEDVLNRVRAYFDDAAGENNTIEEEEYKALADKIMHIPAFNHSGFKMLEFKDYSDEYDDNAATIEKFEMTMKLRPVMKEFFEKKKQELKANLQREEKEAEDAWERLKKKFKASSSKNEANVKMIDEEKKS